MTLPVVVGFTAASVAVLAIEGVSPVFRGTNPAIMSAAPRSMELGSEVGRPRTSPDRAAEVCPAVRTLRGPHTLYIDVCRVLDSGWVTRVVSP